MMATGFCCWHEFQRLDVFQQSGAGVLAWLTMWDSETTAVLFVLLFFPVLLRSSRARAGTTASAPPLLESRVCSLLLGALAFLVSAGIGSRQIPLPAEGTADARESLSFQQLPWAYHDEFSYELQAETFLAGRLSWPATDIAGDAFHQIHVLNRPVTASRYFPWTGIWIMPFHAIGAAIWGHWVAGGLSCLILHRVLLRMMMPWAAFAGGLMLAFSPGLAVFSNLLLSHHPTMLALSVFTWAFLRMTTGGRVLYATVSGIGLTCAMLGRPMTAAGFGLPFGVWLLIDLLRADQQRVLKLSRSAVTVCFALPLCAGFLTLFIMNYCLTGDWLHSAYQFYTDTWTPRHRYGFGNADVAEPDSAVLASYNNWAENLTPGLAVRNVNVRLTHSLIWVLGLPALLLLLPVGVISLVVAGRHRRSLGLISAAIVSLHLVHIPYWYDGIMHWHYVFETGPLLLMVAALGCQQFVEAFGTRLNRRRMRWWLFAVLLATLLPAFVDAPSLWGASRVSGAVSEQSFSRVRQHVFRTLINSAQVQRPAVILVDESGGDQQLSYIINPPDLNADVLVCRKPSSPGHFEDLLQRFPRHQYYEFDPQTLRLKPVR